MEEQTERIEEQEKSKALFKNIVFVFFSSLVVILAGVLAGLLVPKIMDVGDYGYYKKFILYTSYAGLLHFGFCDGIFLFYSGKNYDELDKDKFSFLTKFYFLFELIFLGLIIGGSFIFLKDVYRVIGIIVAINIYFTNIVSYFELLTQAVSKFKLLSIRKLINGFLTIGIVVILFVVYKTSGVGPKFYLYAALTTGINVLLAGLYCITYRKIVFSLPKQKYYGEVGKLFKVGVVLLVSNLISQLVFLVDQQFVSIAFPNEDYAIYAFAYSMVNIISNAICAVSAVIFPTLKKQDNDEALEKYSFANAITHIFAAASLLSYFVFYFIIKYYLDKYMGSLNILKIILPGLLLTTSISIIKYNYYKRFNMIKQYLIISLSILLLAIGADFLLYYTTHSMEWLSIVSVIVIFVWYLIVELYLHHKHPQTKFIKNLIFIVVCVTGYYLTYLVNNIWLELAIYLPVLILSCIIFYRAEIKNLFLTLFKKK